MAADLETGTNTAAPGTASLASPSLPVTRVADPADLPFVTDAGERRGDMLYRRFGRTSEMISAIGLGGFHLGKKALTDLEAVRLVHEAVDRGITFLDNCWDYNQGKSELRVGAALSQGGYRDRVFLMTKIDGRSKAEAAEQIDTSADASANRSDRPHPAHTKSYASTIRIGFLPKVGRWKRSSRHVRPASCAISASPGIRIRAFICRCWR